MGYLKEILWFCMWPGLIFFSYLAVKFALKKFKLYDDEK